MNTTHTAWLPTERLAVPQSSLATACYGNRRVAELLNFFLIKGGKQIKNLEEGCKTVTLELSHEEILKNVSFSSETTLIKFLKMLNAWKYVLSQPYGKTFIVNFEAVNQIIGDTLLEQETYEIYRIIDPRDQSAYIGLSKNAQKRLRGHRKPGMPLAQWLEDMRIHGIKPILEIIERVKGIENARKRERYWIEYYAPQCYLRNTQWNIENAELRREQQNFPRVKNPSLPHSEWDKAYSRMLQIAKEIEKTHQIQLSTPEIVHFTAISVGLVEIPGEGEEER